MNPVRTAVALAMLTASLAACTSVGRVAAPRSVVDFGPPVEALPGRAAAWRGIGLDVRAPAWFDSLGIGYRLAYADPTRLHDYAETRWAGPPAQLVAQRLRQRLDLAPAAGVCNALVLLDEFSQTFDSATASRGVVRGNATLADRRGVLIARTTLAVDAAAPSADARGGVAALAHAVDRSAATLHAWLDELAAKGALKSCGGE